MIKKKNDEEIINYRLEKINKIKKAPSKKGFKRFFGEKINSMIDTNLDSSSSMSQRIFNKSVNKKNVTLRILDFEQDDQSQIDFEKNNKLNLRIKYFSFLIYILSFIVYKESLFSCKNLSLNDCVNQYNIKKVFLCFFKCVISGLILSTNISFIFLKLLSVLHVFILFIFIFLLLIIDFGNDIYHHGLLNFIILLISTFIGFFFLTIIQIVIYLFASKNYRKGIILLIPVIIVLSLLGLGYSLIISCNYWSKGLKDTHIDNDKNKYSCKIVPPKRCYVNALKNFFDFSKMQEYSCDTQGKSSFGEILDNYNLYFDTEFNEETTVLNYPLTNNGNYSGDEFTEPYNLAKKIISNIKGDVIKDKENSEVFLVKDGNKGKIEMNINQNESLIKERKNLENDSLKIKNIIFIYFDSLSRVQLHRQLKSFSNLLSAIFDDSYAKYESFQFLKYHVFDNFNSNKNIHSIFYGTSNINNNEEKNLNILTHLKQNGYITAQSSNICSKYLSSFYPKSLNEEFDYENMAMFCDPNYFITNKRTSNIKGINSSFRRCIHGKDTFEYVINYGKLFWDIYSQSNKFLRLGFFDGNEKTGEVVKYLDHNLTNFILNILDNGKFYRTALFLVSSKGGLEYGIFDKIKQNEFFFERNLGSWFIILNKKRIGNQTIENLKNNMQTFVTPYDIYDSMLSIIYNCYEMSCFEKIKYKSNNGNSVFNYINAFERNCEKYKEINKENCHCIKY